MCELMEKNKMLNEMSKIQTRSGKFHFTWKALRIILVAGALPFLNTGCSDNSADEKDNETKEFNESTEHSDVIKLTDSDLKEFGIEINEAKAGVIINHIDVTGEIIAEPSRLSHLIPRYSGIVKEVYKTVGEEVKQGDVLALIESNESLTTYEVQSLIDGTIIELHMAKGDLVGGEELALTVANLDKVWATLSIYQRDMNKIKVGQRALVSFGSEDKGEAGTISYVSPVVDEATRTATARVIMNNTSGKWRPGMFVSAKIFVSEKTVPIVVEKSALQTLEDKTVVFIKSGEDFFPQQVKLGIQNDVNVEVTSGLQAGQQYVSKGSFTLKAEILKESFGGDEH